LRKITTRDTLQLAHAAILRNNGKGVSPGLGPGARGNPISPRAFLPFYFCVFRLLFIF
jgi:hypothetical protein